MTQRRDRPHILLITCHDIGRHLGCYGIPTVHTPTLDALATEGVRFTRAFTTAPSCSPSRASLATGRYPHCNGVMGLAHPPFGWDLADGERHLAQILGDAGYETHLFGHQHVSPRVARLGFQHLHGFDRILGCHETALGSTVMGRIQEYLAAPWGDKPLYIEVNLEEPHRPYDQGGATPDRSNGVYLPPYLPDEPAAYEEMADVQGAIRQADAALGQIVPALRAALGSNLLVIFAADHGLAMPRAKCTLYDPGIEIALIMHWPDGSLAGGRIIPDMVSNIDVAPTLLELIGAPAPGALQGHSVLPLLRGEPFIARTAIHAEKTYHTYYDPMRAIRTERFKYIRNFETTCRVEVPGDVQGGAIFRAHPQIYHDVQHPPVELYDLESDPLEQRNLAGSPEYDEVERWLDGSLWTWMADTDDPLLYAPVPSPAARRSWAAARQFQQQRTAAGNTEDADAVR